MSNPIPKTIKPAIGANKKPAIVNDSQPSAQRIKLKFLINMVNSLLAFIIYPFTSLTELRDTFC